MTDNTHTHMHDNHDFMFTSVVTAKMVHACCTTMSLPDSSSSCRLYRFALRTDAVILIPIPE